MQPERNDSAPEPSPFASALRGSLSGDICASDNATANIVLRVAPPDLGCDAIPVSYRHVTFHIDPGAAEQVSALTDTGAVLNTYWPAGFTLGSAGDRVIRDPKGAVVVADSDTLVIAAVEWPRIHDYFVCPTPNALYVLLDDPQ